MRVLGRFFTGSAGAGPFSRKARAGLALKVTLAVWAVVLIAAAVLKAYSLYRYGEMLFGSRVLMALVIMVELMSAGALVLNPNIARARVLGMILFGGFAVAALVEGVQGRASCGCFGPLAVSPWYTLALDLTAVASLVMCGQAFAGLCSRRFALRYMIPGLMVALALGSVAYGIASSLPREGVVVLEPEKWIGKRFPLFNRLSSDADLETGEWTVLLYHHDCPACYPAIANCLGVYYHRLQGIGVQTDSVALIDAECCIYHKADRK